MSLERLNVIMIKLDALETIASPLAYAKLYRELIDVEIDMLSAEPDATLERHIGYETYNKLIVNAYNRCITRIEKLARL